MTSPHRPNLPTSTPLSTSTPVSTVSPALVRFVTDGLVATIDSFRAGQLPLLRLTWELAVRTETLTELAPAGTASTRLRWAQRAIAGVIAGVHAELAATGRDGLAAALTPDEENSLTVTLVSLRTALAGLGPDSPPDPSGAARPAPMARPWPELRCLA